MLRAFLKRESFSRLCSVSATAVRRSATSAMESLNSADAKTGSLGRAIADEFRQNPQKAAQDIAQNLGELDRALLISALSAAESSQGSKTAVVENYAEALFTTADQQSPKGLLDKAEFVQALSAYNVLQQKAAAAKGALPLRPRLLFALALATGIPYVGFGFLDNFVMITTGEEIEHAFGVRLGLSTMAAAALGNMMSDIAGIWMAETIEQKTKNMKSLRAPKLSHVQETMLSVRMAKNVGAILGVVVGCTLGMVPLLWYDNPSQSDACKKQDDQADR